MPVGGGKPGAVYGWDLSSRHLLWPTVAVVQSLNGAQLFATQWTAAHQAPLSFTVSWSSLRFLSTELVMLSNHRIPCLPLLLWPSVFPSIRVFANDELPSFTKHCLRTSSDGFLCWVLGTQRWKRHSPCPKHPTSTPSEEADLLDF